METSVVIRVIDIETTGEKPPEAAVCEIGFCDIDARADLAGDPTDWQVVGGRGVLVNPGRPIPPEVSAIHHLIDEDVSAADAWDFASAPIIAQSFVMGAPIIAFAAHSAKFERLFITEEMVGNRPWICTYKCALRLWPDAPSHSNQALRYWRRPHGLDRSVAPSGHRAYQDAYVTAFLLRDILGMATVDDLLKWSSEPALQVRCHIGKWRGTPWRDVDDGFLFWVLDKDFDEDVIFTVKHEIDRREKERRAGEAA